MPSSFSRRRQRFRPAAYREADRPHGHSPGTPASVGLLPRTRENGSSRSFSRPPGGSERREGHGVFLELNAVNDVFVRFWGSVGRAEVWAERVPPGGSKAQFGFSVARDLEGARRRDVLPPCLRAGDELPVVQSSSARSGDPRIFSSAYLRWFRIGVGGGARDGHRGSRSRSVKCCCLLACRAEIEAANSLLAWAGYWLGLKGRTPPPRANPVVIRLRRRRRAPGGLKGWDAATHLLKDNFVRDGPGSLALRRVGCPGEPALYAGAGILVVRGNKSLKPQAGSRCAQVRRHDVVEGQLGREREERVLACCRGGSPGLG